MGEMAHRWGPLEELAVAKEDSMVGQQERKAMAMGHHHRHRYYVVHPPLLCSPRCTIRTAVELAAVLGL